MRILTELPRPVRSIEHTWIPLPDGGRLAARIWLPEDADATPVPAVLEYLPYRKRDLTRARDEPMHHYLAGHGYAAVRVDLRGTGDSDGVLRDEYLEQEHDDGAAVIGWLAAQPWCTGAVGMMGTSWGGFNALQIAARRPPALRAIVTVCASEDRYADDAHFMGGCLLNENFTWGAALLAFATLPPDPALVGERWRAMWLERIEEALPFPAIWLHHQRRDAYWRRGSVCEDLSRITCPVYAVGGWADAYTNAIPRLLAGLRVPCRALVGPWGHFYPHAGVPGPAIGFLQEIRRWWDQWLKGTNTGIMHEPAYRVWMQESDRPRAFHFERPGRWVAESAWPSSRITARRYGLAPGRIGGAVDQGTRVAWRSPQTVGAAAGDWCSFGLEGELPADQREDDRGSLTFDSEPLDTRLEILGAPAVELAVAVDRPCAFLAIRLNEVFPDGASARVSYGLLNLTHREGHVEPAPLLAGRLYLVRVELGHVAHAFAAGTRLRLAISTAYWPIAWPAPHPVTLTIFPGRSALELPVRPPAADDDRLRPFEAPETARPLAYTELAPAQGERTVTRDAATGELVHVITGEGAGFGAAGPSRIDAIDLEVAHSARRHYVIRAEDPLTARAEVVQWIGFGRGTWRPSVESRVSCTATADAFVLSTRLEACEAGVVVRSRRWDQTIPRDGV